MCAEKIIIERMEKGRWYSIYDIQELKDCEYMDTEGVRRVLEKSPKFEKRYSKGKRGIQSEFRLKGVGSGKRTNI